MGNPATRELTGINSMNDRPNALELIRIASATLASDVLPDAKPEQAYALRMIANALGIAARELETHDLNVEQEARGLNALYGDRSGNIGSPDELLACNRRLALDIRRGNFEDSDARASALRQHLLATARAKLAAAYPKGLPPS
jgi:hypothetical protein